MSAWLPAAPCTPQRCAGHGGASRTPPHAALLLLTGCLLTLLGVLALPLVPLLGTHRRDRLVSGWAYAVVRGFGVRVRVTGRPAGGARPRPGELVVANHISWLDVLLVASVFPARMVAKAEIRHWPLLGPLAALGGTLFVDRDRLRTLPGSVRAMAGALRGGSRVAVFPQGSTWCGRGPGGPFRPAAFQAAIDAGAAVRPVRISYRTTGPDAAGAAAFVGDDPLTASLWRVVTAAGLTAEISVLPPLPAGSGPGRRALARAAQRAVDSDSANRPAASVHH
ncbi:1-acyl-sn-glycerol-3-phosphate acyltransferase [Streptomyces nitrosporeus]|uniref:1-acyl-sn-glycerol-3-phosphate acyltransferase n=1 Tax=Streptomyces nitrosporeus TaxID=28894 RepID=A0A5J6F2Y9_9ACTN|nr:lysophospholipid acyltransferase family protein [Streptomyces nitrosporeus]QEU70659.1 1-acyl-sn-glycerol-3-phosphate acyltransferase [Streptomyces nitrosporeus]GGZ06075.1 1-acyl-sn-glycerol-3-phosphate acyltransferase [Streptomyces nitrosporeus]